jgi:hypothetical protein
MEQKNPKRIDNLSKLLITVALIALIVVLAYKLIVTPIQFSLDAPTILSLLLALFSIYLSALFYFKATETSNSFYDNTYKFTKDIAELLVRIESGFGERLRHLDESYTKIQGQFERYTHPDDAEKTQEEANKSKTELEEKLKDRDNIIEELANRAKLEGRERDDILNRLSNAENELENARNQLSLYQNELARIKSIEQDELVEEDKNLVLYRVSRYLRSDILPKLDPAFIARAPSNLIVRRWKDQVDAVSNAFLKDLLLLKFVDNHYDLTPTGIRKFKAEAHRLLGSSESE